METTIKNFLPNPERFIKLSDYLRAINLLIEDSMNDKPVIQTSYEDLNDYENDAANLRDWHLYYNLLIQKKEKLEVLLRQCN